MRHWVQRPAEPGHRHEPVPPADLVIIGHVGSATDRTANGTITYVGGSGFATAFAAAALLGHVGLVAQVGADFDLDILRRLPVDMAGVSVLPGVSAAFSIDLFRDGHLAFSSDLGVAAEPRFDLFPEPYFRARYVHVGTAPPHQQLRWLKFLRDKGCRAQISVDMFEPFVTEEPEVCRTICDRADLIFLNEAEHRGLYQGRPQPSAPMILKYGPAGAEIRAEGVQHRRIPAPDVREVDPIGAGEILAGSFLALRARGLPDGRVLFHSVAAASRSVTEFGVAGPGVTAELQRVRDELAATDHGAPPWLRILSGASALARASRRRP
jgi:sugar/nucleoside kinase (ribokinase family)